MNIKTQGYAALAVLSFYPYNCLKVSVLGLGNVSISFPRGRKPSKEADQNSHSLWKVERNFYIDLFLSNKVKKLTGSFNDRTMSGKARVSDYHIYKRLRSV